MRKILITDCSMNVANRIKSALMGGDYDIRTVSDGEECLVVAKMFKPHLIFIDLTLFKVHGIDVLKALHSDPETKDIGVVIFSGSAMSQDYQVAIDNGADYYLLCPFDAAKIVSIVNKFFEGTLKPDTFEDLCMCLSGDNQSGYDPQPKAKKSYLKLWGTRGSIPVSGLDYYRYGGNTSCLEISDGNHMIIIDAGTGIRPLGDEMLKSDHKEIHLFIGHTHWDHIIGFPFFAPAFHPGYTLHIYAAKGFHRGIKELFTGMLEHDFFPVRLGDLQTKIIFHDLADGTPIVIGDVTIHYTYAQHPGATLCFKIRRKDRSIGYVTDNEFLVGYHGYPGRIGEDHTLLAPYKEMIGFFRGCEMLIHEAQYSPREYKDKVGWGHSSISNAALLVKLCDVAEWVITHHDPRDHDKALLTKAELNREIREDCNVKCRAFMAYDGLTLPL